MKPLRGPVFALLIAASGGTVLAQEETRLLRFPAIHENKVVFSYAGNLYSVDSAGGIARRLTSNIGYEIFPRFSPDGKQIAFTGQYDGNTEVYLIPSEGGVPKRLTYTATLGRDDVSDRMGPNNIVMTWVDDDQIVFRSRMIEPNSFIGQLFSVSTLGDIPEQLPLPRGGFCSFAPDGARMAYNRVFREFRTWKRYRGGQADDIWIYDFHTKGVENITKNPSQDIIPMWHGGRIYFLSDRDRGRMNLYAYELASKQTKKLTDFRDFDIKFPSLGTGQIVFENGGYLYRFDTKNENLHKVPVFIHEDRDIGRGGLIQVGNAISNYEISPGGERALMGARGEVFTLPAKKGNTRNLTNSSGVHERNSKWSPDGKWISYISDATGEDEIYIIPQDGSTAATQLTRGGDTYKYQPLWSPDSKKLLWGDRRQRLQFVDIDSRKVILIEQAKAWEIISYAWSPDSLWVTYVRPEEFSHNTVQLYSLTDGQIHEVSSGWFESSNPAFSADGKFLMFVSNRSFNATYSQIEWNYAYMDMAGIYLVALANDTPSPFAPRSDEVKLEAQPAEETPPGAGTQTTTTTLRVDLPGLSQRIMSLPIQPSSYFNLASVGKKIYYQRRGTQDRAAKLMLYDLEQEKETELGDVNGYEISADGKKILVHSAGSYAILDLPSSRINITEKLDVQDMTMRLDRKAEWEQIYRECWRQMRDFFYAPNMHGVDWEAVQTRYEPLLQHVNHRADLTYVIGEMIGELNAGHTYVGGGDYPQAARIRTGLLGASIRRDSTSGYYRIVKILKGQNWDRRLRSPLTEMGVRIQEGDYILAVDGRSTQGMVNIYEALLGKAGKQVVLRVNGRAAEEGARDEVVIPTDDEQPLVYLNWVERNIETVSKATGGRVGYVHIPDMGVNGLNQFVKYYYPQLRRDALIVDVRGNGGGNVSPMIIERLRRELAMITVARNSTISPDPGGFVVGPKVLLIDEFSASDGDIVAYRFKKHGLGTVIGKRTWGGVVGIRGSLPLVDGGYLNKPEFSRYDVEGKEWIMEGVGVEPDIEVDNDPAEEFSGRDQQLNKAIEVVLEELKKRPGLLPSPPPYPVKP